MELIGLILIGLGFMVVLISGIWFLVVAFRESVLWGLACLFIPIAQLFFLIVHWPVAKRPFLYQLSGLVLIIIGALINPQGFHR